jgi:Ca2+-binding RTX toxin-like protein
MRIQIRTMLAAGILAAGLAATTAVAHASPPYKISRGTLVVVGTNANDKLALRLEAGHPKTLEIDFDDDGRADIRVNRKRFDRIRVKTLSGNDQVRIDDAGGAIRIPARVDGGRGDDILTGGRGKQRFYAGPGNDTVDGNHGADKADLGAGEDRFIWDPGDGSDAVDGRLGQDALNFKGSSADERIAVSADGHRARLTRDVGHMRMNLRRVEQVDVAADAGDDTLEADDLAATDVRTVNEDLGTGSDEAIVNGTNANDEITAAGSAAMTGLAATVNTRNAEDLTINALGGADSMVVNDLSGTDVTAVRTDVSGPTDDGAHDQVVVTGTDGDDVATVTGAAGSASVLGLPARVDVIHAASDDLTIDVRNGADAVESSGLAADAIRLTADGGDGDDVLIGGPGAETLLGRGGDDVLIGGDGNDILDGGPGDNIVIQ